MGMFGSSYGGAPMAMASNVGALQQPLPDFNQPAQKKPNMLLGVIASALSGAAGQRSAFTDNLYRQREMDERQQMLEQQRETDWQDFVRQYQYQLANPKPKAPSEFDEALVAAGIDPRSPEGQALYRQRATNMADPLRFVPGVDAQGNEVLRGVRAGSMGGGAPTPPPVLSDDDWGDVGGAGSLAPRPFP